MKDLMLLTSRTVVLLFLWTGILSFSGYSQHTDFRNRPNYTPPSAIDRYKVDYELADETHLASDSSVLLLLPLDELELQRLEHVDITVHSGVDSIEIVLYSENRVAINKRMQSGRIRNIDSNSTTIKK